MDAIQALSRYLNGNLWQGLRTPPTEAAGLAALLALAFAALALPLGWAWGQFGWGLPEHLPWYLPLALLVLPVLLEEAVFRGLLLPLSLAKAPLSTKARWILASALLFTAWHPLNAWLVNVTARPFFYDPAFLFIVFLLGLGTGTAYVQSRSLWTSILMHWLTVLVWVLLLGGHSLVLQAVS
ncbi:CPBP family glutamic-type intramembrane protease [Gallaecimonas sp. GXIMD4217]|uniref:CPBP family glutamic-type intramembrane protease n=1 Tax=Gallaecimonas sp. GXIMD4217 TaxID=3131927 RepID=UPI00311ACC64